ncbi:MAG: trmK [Firmicutes bacterium]|nr:trmK [Bacillota bacterium]
MLLRPRLSAIAAFVARGSRVADIGTDHAYLPVFLLRTGIAEQVIAVDVHHGPYQAAVETVTSAGLVEAISVRFGDGLTVLGQGEADTVVIAGMGGNTIVKILEDSLPVTQSLTRLILQPMVASATIRRWLAANGWCIVDETLVEEDHILYEIIVAEQGTVFPYPPVFDDIGPKLWVQRHPLLRNHIERLIVQYSSILTEMSKSPAASSTIKYQEYARKIAELEEKCACL